MPLNPFTGEFEGYDSPSTAAGIGMSALSVAGVETPLAYRILEDMPGIFASIGFSSMRGANTLMYGGYKEGKTPKFIGRKARREAAAAAGKSPMLRPMIASNIPGPRNFRRFRSTSIFNPIEAGGYTPFGAAGFLGKNARVQEKFKAAGLEVDSNKSILSGGLLSAISAGTKIDALEARAANGSARAAVRLQRVYSNISNVGFPDPMGRSTLLSGVAPVGAGGNAAAASMGAAGTAMMAGYVRGALGYADTGGFMGRNADAALKGAQKAKSRFTTIMASDAMKDFADKVDYKDLARGGKGLFGSLGTKGTMAFMGQQGGKAFAASRALGLAIPGLQVVAAASLLYDVGKIGGEIIKSGINLARDASTSLQGSLAKPIFGMGYRDSEAAATSRARGVMAISNSRLNARSILGSEASQLAAYYG